MWCPRSFWGLHRWGKWGEPTLYDTTRFATTASGVVIGEPLRFTSEQQARACERCGLQELRRV